MILGIHLSTATCLSSPLRNLARTGESGRKILGVINNEVRYVSRKAISQDNNGKRNRNKTKK